MSLYKRLFLLGLCLALSGFLATVAHAGPYFEARGAASFLDDADVEISGTNAGEIDFDPGYTASGALGYDFSDVDWWKSFRIEGEGFFSRNDVDSVRGPGSAFFKVDDVTMTGGLFNLFYDFPLGALQPYIGAGVGGAKFDVDDGFIDDSDTVLVYQARAGLGYAITPSIIASIGYRFFDANDPVLKFGIPTNFGGPLVRKLETEYRSHSVEVGLRFHF